MNDNDRTNNLAIATQTNQNTDLEAGRTTEHLEQAGGRRINLPRRATRWLVRKFRELLFIGLVGIPAGLLWLESQSSKQGGVAADWLNNAGPMYGPLRSPRPPSSGLAERLTAFYSIWLVWVCIGVILALDNFDYLQE